MTLQMQTLIQNLLMFLIYILIGYLLQTKNIISRQFQYDLSSFILQVTTPCLLFSAIAQPFNSSLLKEGIMAFVLMLFCFIIGYTVGIVSFKLLKIEKTRRGVWVLGTTFSNLGFMGFPVVSALLGSEGLFIASFINIAFNILFFTAGIIIISKDQEQEHSFDWKKIFLNNIMLSIFLGLFFFFTQISISPLIRNTAQNLGNMTSPLAMLVIGLKLGEFSIKEVFTGKKQYQLSLLRLIVVPAIVIILLKLLPLNEDSLLLPVLIILNAMPIAVNTIIVANQYGGDGEFIAKATTLSSILCLLTIPVILYFI